MRHFCFLSSGSQEQIRDKVDKMISVDGPKFEARGYQKNATGLHFQKNDSVISGFFLNWLLSSAGETSPRARCGFRGKFEKKEDGSLCFKGWIFPCSVWDAVYLAVCILLFIFGGAAGAAAALLGVGAMVFGYIHLIKDAYTALKRVFQ